MATRLYKAGFSAQRCGDYHCVCSTFFEPYHAAIAGAIHTRLGAQHTNIVLYDCHSIRSSIPRLFEGVLPNFNIGTNNGATCATGLTRAVEAACDGT